MFKEKASNIEKTEIFKKYCEHDEIEGFKR